MDSVNSQSEYVRKDQLRAENPWMTEGWLNDICHHAHENGMEAAGAILRIKKENASRGIVIIHRKKFFQTLESKAKKVAA